MTSKPRIPIYTPQDLAELVAQHDRDHPDHTAGCDCDNGLINTLRIYFAPTVSIVTEGPRPYIPPDIEPPQTTEDPSERKPWLKQREGETREDYDHRISHSCYNCGTYIVDRKALAAHEDTCSGQGRRATGDQ